MFGCVVQLLSHMSSIDRERLVLDMSLKGSIKVTTESTEERSSILRHSYPVEFSVSDSYLCLHLWAPGGRERWEEE